jgi:hypothetical protein
MKVETTRFQQWLQCGFDFSEPLSGVAVQGGGAALCSNAALQLGQLGLHSEGLPGINA